jgi:hypothetical protein
MRRVRDSEPIIRHKKRERRSKSTIKKQGRELAHHSVGLSGLFMPSISLLLFVLFDLLSRFLIFLSALRKKGELMRLPFKFGPTGGSIVA